MQKQPPEVFCKKRYIWKFSNFIGKYLRWSLEGLQRVSNTGIFLWNFAKFLRTPIFESSQKKSVKKVFWDVLLQPVDTTTSAERKICSTESGSAVTKLGVLLKICLLACLLACLLRYWGVLYFNRKQKLCKFSYSGKDLRGVLSYSFLVYATFLGKSRHSFLSLTKWLAVIYWGSLNQDVLLINWLF